MKTIIQDHSILAKRCDAMARHLRSLNKPSNDQLKAAADLEEQAAEHYHKAMMFPNQKFVFYPMRF